MSGLTCFLLPSLPPLLPFFLPSLLKLLRAPDEKHPSTQLWSLDFTTQAAFVGGGREMQGGGRKCTGELGTCPSARGMDVLRQGQTHLRDTGVTLKGSQWPILG